MHFNAQSYGGHKVKVYCDQMPQTFHRSIKDIELLHNDQRNFLLKIIHYLLSVLEENSGIALDETVAKNT